MTTQSQQSKKVNVAVIGASGYTGGDLVRLAACHTNIELKELVAHSHAGQEMADVFPHLAYLRLPKLKAWNDVNWDTIDAVFCGLPHGTARDIIVQLPDHLKIIDMSADFRIRDPELYQKWYGRSHDAEGLLQEAVYGLTEFYSGEIETARLVACPGCYPTATLLALLPLLQNQVIDPSDIIIDAKSGVSGAGRGLKQNTLFTEAGEGLSPYSIGKHRHAPEIEQELSKAVHESVTVNFTPHLVPMSRGELITAYVKLHPDCSWGDLKRVLEKKYMTSTFVKVLPEEKVPATQHVRGSNYCHINVFPDRIAGRAIVISALDNLVKGSAGQALQNFNVMFGFDEALGLQQQALFP
ncbi:MAG: N-acetyl-gamma-glutamyl-phosphate reductase [Pseudomonadota bacterium]